MLQAPWSEIKDKHVSQVLDATIQASSWTPWQLVDPWSGDLTELGWPEAETGKHLWLAHPYTQVMGYMEKGRLPEKRSFIIK